MFEKDFRVGYLLDFYGEILTDKQRDAIDLYYNEDLSLAEIAEHAQITRQGVRDAIKRGEEILLEMEDKLGYAAKIEENNSIMAKVNDAARKIKFSKNSLDFYKTLDEGLNEIISLTNPPSQN